MSEVDSSGYTSSSCVAPPVSDPILAEGYMLFRPSRRLSVLGVDNHTEFNVLKAEAKDTGAQIATRDEERQRRIEILLVLVAVSVAFFVVSKLGFFEGLLLAAFCAAMFCVAYASSFLRLTGATNTPIPLGERLGSAFGKIMEWAESTVDDLRDRPSTDSYASSAATAQRHF